MPCPLLEARAARRAAADELQALQDSPAVREYDGICAKNEFLHKEVKELGDALSAAEAAVEELEAQEKHLTGELHLAQKQGQGQTQ